MAPHFVTVYGMKWHGSIEWPLLGLMAMARERIGTTGVRA